MIDRGQMRVLKFQDIVFTVKGKGDECKPILQNISHEIRAGQMVAVLGPSGSGKVNVLPFAFISTGYFKINQML